MPELVASRVNVSEKVSAEAPPQPGSFLSGCLVEGDSAQEARVRRNRRRAFLVSIAIEILVVAALVLFPLFSKGENIANRAVFVPAVPYNPGRPQPVQPETQHHSTRRPDPSQFSIQHAIPNGIVEHDDHITGTAETGPDSSIVGAPTGGDSLPGLLTASDGPRRPEPLAAPHHIDRLKISAPIEAAMLLHRVDPTYPPLARQIRREGRVELHAIIATDGTIQALEVLNGDPLFISSALAAVRQWRYRPTILDGQPIEVDTHITVLYTLNP